MMVWCGSSDEELPVEEIAVASDEDMPVATDASSSIRRWASGVLRPVAGVEVDMPLPQDVDDKFVAAGTVLRWKLEQDD